MVVGRDSNLELWLCPRDKDLAAEHSRGRYLRLFRRTGASEKGPLVVEPMTFRADEGGPPVQAEMKAFFVASAFMDMISEAEMLRKSDFDVWFGRLILHGEGRTIVVLTALRADDLFFELRVNRENGAYEAKWGVGSIP